MINKKDDTDEKRIKDIMSTNGMPDTAICDFEFVKKHLINCRAAARLPENAKSIIMAIFPYKVENKPPKNISRYAAVPDYHKICGEFLENAVMSLQKCYVNQSGIIIPFLWIKSLSGWMTVFLTPHNVSDSC